MVEPGAAAGGAAAGPAGSRFFKLPDFWAASPVAWFGVVESQFRLRGVEAQEDRFSLVSAVLPESVARRVAHLLVAPPEEDPYDALKAALLSAHQLTDIQRAERLFNMDALGARRPMELLTEMLELVDPGEEKTKLFAMLFLRRLPAAVRVQLTEDDHTDLRALAEKADRCAASLLKQSAEIAAVAEAAEEECGSDVAAVRGGGASRWRRGNGRGGHRSGGKQQSAGQQQRADGGGASNLPTDAPADMARLTTGLCFFHFCYGSKAKRCTAPCSWQAGN